MTQSRHGDVLTVTKGSVIATPSQLCLDDRPAVQYCPPAVRCRLTPAPLAAGVGDEVMAAETASLVRAAVQLLPASQRQVVELAYFEGLTCREVAHAAGIPEGTAKSRLRLALAKLEELLDRQLLESS